MTAMMRARASARRFWAALLAVAVVAGAVVVAFTRAQGADAALTGPVQPKVVGNHLVDSRTGAVWTPRGANWPDLEYSCVQGWTPSSDPASMAAAASWGMDVMRIPLNQDCWLGVDGAPTSGTAAQYRARVQARVDAVHAAGMVAILDLHWTAPAGTRAVDGQWPMADDQSAQFWASVAAAYRADPSVMFDLFNEPYSRGSYSLSWSCWRDGGCSLPNAPDTESLNGSTFTATGMAALVAAVRGAGAGQPILLAGLNYANDLTGWLAHRPNDSQLVASWHNYDGQGCSNASCWNSQIAQVAAQVPVLMTEVGYETGNPGYFAGAMAWADSAGIGYLPWAWWNDTQSYALFTGNSYAPRAGEGLTYQAHLAALAAAGAGGGGSGGAASSSAAPSSTAPRSTAPSSTAPSKTGSGGAGSSGTGSAGSSGVSSGTGAPSSAKPSPAASGTGSSGAASGATTPGGAGSSAAGPARVPVAAVGLNRATATVKTGQRLALTATVRPAAATNKKVDWSSSNPRVASVSSTGVVTGKASGTATITAKTADGGKTAKCKVTVRRPVSAVRLSKKSATLAVGARLRLRATVSPAGATNKAVRWSSSNRRVAIVNANGVITAKRPGKVTITVRTVSGGKTAKCVLRVKPR
ncbi:MAG: Ig-like domain-containing protein [Actinomycetia bacterium]|nr:Ig-like domain-containing protein [Actinomycetes bacterium]